MNNNLFSATRDREMIEAGGFFCQACLVGKPLDDRSTDPRYCLGCYEFLRAEAKLERQTKKAFWVPAADYIGRGEALPIQKKPVAKLPDKGMTPAGIMQHPVGRPRKEGKVHRTTEWRRKKVMQGVLL